MSVVSAEGLSKSYAGARAVQDLSFSVESGEPLGLIGPNGAGKSSTIKMVLDFIRPDAGRISVLGGAMDESRKNRVGYLPEEKGLYQDLPAIDLMVYLASLKGVDRKTARIRAGDMLDRFQIAGGGSKRIRELSKGMAQMVQVAVTIVHEPELVILDEPFSGLDPVNTELLKGIVADLRARGAAVVLSTHQMNQVEELCDRVLMIDRGRAVLYGSVHETTARYRRRSVRVEVESSAAGVELGALPGVAVARPAGHGVELELDATHTPMQVLDALRERGVDLAKFEVVTPSLHEVFLKLAGGTAGGTAE